MFEDNNEKYKLEIPNLSVVKGLLSIILGVMFVVFSFRIILNFIFLVLGSMLIYYGLAVLKMKKATDYIDNIVGRIRNLFA